MKPSSSSDTEQQAPTPRTDALLAAWPSTLDTEGDARKMQSMVAHARWLERELDDARMDFEGRKASEEYAVKEANRLLEELNELKAARPSIERIERSPESIERIYQEAIGCAQRENPEDSTANWRRVGLNHVYAAGKREAALSHVAALTDKEADARLKKLCDETHPPLLLSVLKGELLVAWMNADNARLSATVASTDAKDAARYRWLRSEQATLKQITRSIDPMGGFELLADEKLDAACDAAMDGTTKEAK